MKFLDPAKVLAFIAKPRTSLAIESLKLEIENDKKVVELARSTRGMSDVEFDRAVKAIVGKMRKLDAMYCELIEGSNDAEA